LSNFNAVFKKNSCVPNYDSLRVGYCYFMLPPTAVELEQEKVIGIFLSVWRADLLLC